MRLSPSPDQFCPIDVVDSSEKSNQRIIRYCSRIIINPNTGSTTVCESKTMKDFCGISSSLPSTYTYQLNHHYPEYRVNCYKMLLWIISPFQHRVKICTVSPLCNKTRNNTITLKTKNDKKKSDRLKKNLSSPNSNLIIMLPGGDSRT